MLKELEKQLASNLADEEQRLKVSIDRLKVKLKEEQKLHDQQISKDKQAFETFKNEQLAEISRLRKEAKNQSVELVDIETDSLSLAKEREEISEGWIELKSAQKQVEDAKTHYADLAEKAKKKEELFQSKIDNLPE